MAHLSVKLPGLLIICFLLSNINSSGQVITGPDCVIASSAYQYLINANWKDSSNIQVCIKGGIFLDSSTCYAGRPVPFLRLIWNENESNGSISLRSSSGNADFSVSLTSGLQGGIIDTASKLQQADTFGIPAMIHCSVATGGNCSPVYNYQWQQAQTNMNWKDIKDATGADLLFDKEINKTTYYRRKVTEVKSTTVQYSDIAIIALKKHGNGKN